MRFVDSFTVEDRFNYGHDAILKEATRIAQQWLRESSHQGNWSLKESRSPEEMEEGGLRYYFDIYVESEPRTLLIDDLRTIKAERVARTYDDGIRALQHEGPWEVLYLDHDLGETDPNKTGYGIMCWLEQRPQYLPGEIKLVTSNPVGREKMQVVIDRLYPKVEPETEE